MQVVGAVVIGYILAQFLDFQFFTESAPTEPAVLDEDQFDEDHPEYILTSVFTANGETVWRYQQSIGTKYNDGAIDERSYESFFIIGNEDGTSFRTESGDGGITVPPRTGQTQVQTWASAEEAIDELTEEPEPPTPGGPEVQPEPEEPEDSPVMPPTMPPTGLGPSQGSFGSLGVNAGAGGASESVFDLRPHIRGFSDGMELQGGG